MQGPPDFVSVPFLIYAVCAKAVFGLGYVLFGYRLPVKNTVARAFAYIMLILAVRKKPSIAMAPNKALMTPRLCPRLLRAPMLYPVSETFIYVLETVRIICYNRSRIPVLCLVVI